MRIDARRIASLLLVVVLLVGTVTTAMAADGYLWDNANLLTEEESSALAADLAEVNAQLDFFCGVMTTNSAGGLTTEDYTDNFYHQNGLGTGANKDGILVAVDMDNREVYIYTYGSAIAIFDDARIEAMLDNAYNGLTEKRYADVFAVFIEDTVAYAAAGVKADQYEYDADTGTVVSRYSDTVEARLPVTTILIFFAIAVAVGGLSCGGVYARYKLVFTKDSYPFREKSELNLTDSHDILLNKQVTSRVIPKNDGGSSGGGSRSTTSRSSGGGSHGGGGRKF